MYSRAHEPNGRFQRTTARKLPHTQVTASRVKMRRAFAAFTACGWLSPFVKVWRCPGIQTSIKSPCLGVHKGVSWKGWYDQMHPRLA